MKLRIKDNSIRLRLNRPEVEQFGKTKMLEGSTDFGNGVFIYAIRYDEHATEINATLSNNRISMNIPPLIAAAFVNSDTVGFQNEIMFGDGRKLFLLFEKDFKCIDGEPLEDQSDNYENPAVNCMA